jgi:hypothetical protein
MRYIGQGKAGHCEKTMGVEVVHVYLTLRHSSDSLVNAIPLDHLILITWCIAPILTHMHSG